MRLIVYMTALLGAAGAAGAQEPTREFEIRDDRPYLAGQRINIWGLRTGNALHSRAVTERHVNSLDNMVAHGINAIGVYIQGSNAGWPDANAAENGYRPNGGLKPEFAERLEWLIREADKRGMIVLVGLFSPRKDQEFENEAAVQKAVEETAKFLTERKLNHERERHRPASGNGRLRAERRRSRHPLLL